MGCMTAQAQIKQGVDAFSPILNHSEIKEVPSNPCDSLAYYRAERAKYKKLYILDHLRVAQGRYYLKIIARKPEQKKYLLGWMRRALE